MEVYSTKSIGRKMSLNPLDHPILFSIPRRLTPISAWHEHIPFAMYLVDLLKPGTLVELGTHYGDSYCAFCQAVLELNLRTRCYAIDTWEGEPHSGLYGPEVLANLREHHDSLYASFSSLVKTTFDDALAYFSDGAIDLLHIDGYHTYEVVKHDFESWLPKMSVCGVVLFHDTNVRERDFGVWKLWEELRQQYLHFEFVHGYGLGMLAVGKDFPTAFQEFLEVSLEDGASIRKFFSQLGQKLTLEVEQRKYHQASVEKEQQLTQVAAERGQFVQEAARLQGTVQSLEQALTESDHQVVHLAAEGDGLTQDLTLVRATVQGQQATILEKQEEISRLAVDKERGFWEKDQEISQILHERKLLSQKIVSIQTQVAGLQVSMRTLRQMLFAIEDSLGWMLLLMYRGLRDTLFPDLTHRRRAYNAVKDFFKSWVGSMKAPTMFYDLVETKELTSSQGMLESELLISAPDLRDRFLAQLFDGSPERSRDYVPIMKNDFLLTS